MRRIVTVSALSVLAVGTVLAGCEKARQPAEAMTADKERDLRLASSVQGQRTGVVSSIEQISNGAPSGQNRGKRVGVRAPRPAPAPSPAPTVTEVAAVPVAREEAAAATTPVEATTTAPAPTPVVAEPAPEPGPSATETSHAPAPGIGAVLGTNPGDAAGSGRGTGSPGIGIQGPIIRGGIPGRDNCEPRMPNTGPAGIIGTIGTIMGGAGAGHAPTGSIPGGNRGYPRR